MGRCYINLDISECLTFEFFIYVIVMGPICVFGIITNTLLCQIFRKMSRLLSASSYILLLSLSVADSLLLITIIANYCIIPLLAFSGLDDTMVQHVSAYVYVYVYFLCNVAHTSSVYVTVVVGVSRYVAVCHPFKLDSLFSRRKTLGVIVSVFVLSTLYHVPPLFECKVVTLNNNNNNSEVILEMIYTFHPLYKLVYDVLIYFVCMNFLPVAILLWVCIVVIAKLKQEKAGVTTSGGGGKEVKDKCHISQRELMEKSVTEMLIAVLVVFLLLQTPAGFNRLAIMSTLKKWIAVDAWECGGVGYYFGHLCNVLVAVNSSVNVIIFVVFNRSVKERLTKLCCTNSTHRELMVLSERTKSTVQVSL